MQGRIDVKFRMRGDKGAWGTRPADTRRGHCLLYVHSATAVGPVAYW